MLISTLEAYFQGKRELFEGLAMEKLEKDWVKYPVLHLDLNTEKYDTPESLENKLNGALVEWEKIYGEEPSEKSLAMRFEGIIKRACQQEGQSVVILVDEYDKPMLQAIGDDVLQKSFRNTLKAFYGALKSQDGCIKFALLTGVTKFGKVSVFSDLNQLQDISLWYDYATVCGITKEELTAVFRPELEVLGKVSELSYEETVDEMTRLYDGYLFHPAGEGVFNPFSVLNALKAKEFNDYWFQTGTPTFLVELLKQSDYDLRVLIDGVEASSAAFSEYRADAENPIPLIYQSGYLTIKEYDKRFKVYRLGFPNDEVKYGFMNFILPFYTPIPDGERRFYIGKFIQELESGDVPAFLTRLKAFFADFSYELNEEKERYYQVIFYLVFKLMGQFTEAEVRSACGRADAVVKTPKYIYVFEFKLNGTAEQALQQIDDKGYLIPYLSDGREVVKVGVEFSAATRNISRWLVE